MPYILFLKKKTAKFEIVVCCKLYLALYGLKFHDHYYEYHNSEDANDAMA